MKKCKGCQTPIKNVATFCVDCRGKNNLERWKKSHKRRRDKLKKQAVEYKGGKCELCGYDKCIQALEFHHLNPKEKSFEISYTSKYRPFDEIKKELDKCLLVCANCHRELEYLADAGGFEPQIPSP